MWLLKKFWHADIVNKIYILIILFIVVVASITVITRYRNASIEKQTNTIENSVVEEFAEENIIEGNTITVANIEEVEIKENKGEVKNENKNNQTKKEEKRAKTTEVYKTANKETDTTLKTTEKPQEVVQDKTKEDIKETIVENNNSNQSEETKQELALEIAKEEYMENTNMINTMKNFIQNNPSDDMIAYGYEIIVDSSIVDSTNQFTYTEQRIKNFLKQRCGTIRIYARDYYYNGDLVMTECYIL